MFVLSHPQFDHAFAISHDFSADRSNKGLRREDLTRKRKAVGQADLPQDSLDRSP